LQRWFDTANTIETIGEQLCHIDRLRAVSFALMHVAYIAVIRVGISWAAVAIAAALHTVRMFAITAFYHRYFSTEPSRHRERCSSCVRVDRVPPACSGPLWWAAHHRHHHWHADQPLRARNGRSRAEGENIMLCTAKLSYIPREDAFSRVMDCLGTGAHVALLAPRSQGKTAFLRNEVMPGAHRAGWLAFRIDLLGTGPDPMAGLVRGLESVEWLAHHYHSGVAVKAPPVSRPRLGWPTVEVAGGATYSYVVPSEERISIAERLASALEAIARLSTRIVILIEGFSNIDLADPHQSMPVLRRLMKALKGSITFLFAESSRAALVDVFRSARAPLYEMVEIIKLAPLSCQFVKSRASFAQQEAGLDLDVNHLYQAFQHVHHVPSFLDEVIMDAIYYGEPDVFKVLERWELGIVGTQAGILHRLTALEFSLLIWLSLPGERNIYGSRAREALGDIMGGAQQPSTTRVQAAMRRLTALAYIESGSRVGEYTIPDPRLAIALRALAAHLMDGTRCGAH